MSTVKFLFGSKTSLPTSAPTNALLFTDTGELFKGTGTTLLPFGSVLYGYSDLDDLKVKAPTGLNGKLYLTADNKLYSFGNGTYNLVAGSSTMESFEASKVTYDKTGTTLVGENLQTVITELDTKVETNKTDITDVKGRVDTLETDNTKNKADIADLQSKEGQVKSSTGDVLGFLDSKVDGTTIQIDGDKLVVKGLDGVTVGSTEINQLTGVTSNVQTQINDLLASISASSSGMAFGGTTNTKVDLDALTNVINGTLYVVLADETNDSGRTMYIYSEDASAFVFVGQFEFAEKFIDLLDTPNAYVDGKVLKSTTDGLVFGDVSFTELTNAPTSNATDIDGAVTKAHEHTFDEVVLNKLTDVDGQLQYDGKSVSTEIQWESFNI